MVKLSRFIKIILCAIFIFVPIVAGAVTSVSHFTGAVSFFDRSKIVVDNIEFRVIEKCVYLKHTKKNNAYFEDKATPNDVRNGRSVILHINGNVVDKIIIEEWK